MRILIAGGGGYIGSALVPKHIDSGYDVESITKELLAHQSEFKNYENPMYYNIQVFKSIKKD